MLDRETSVNSETRAYWRQRASEERTRAQACHDDAVRSVHERMANLYEGQLQASGANDAP